MVFKNYKEGAGYKTGEYALTQDEVESIISNCNTPFEKILLKVGIATGCRRSDLCAIEKANIDVKNMCLTYIERKKGGRIMKANFGGSLNTDLKQYISTLPTKCKWLFPSPYGYDKHISDRTIWNIFNTVCERAGISQRPVHALRATFVKQAIANGWTMLQIADHIGDAPSTVEKYYAVPSIGEMAEVAKNKEVI